MWGVTRCVPLQKAYVRLLVDVFHVQLTSVREFLLQCKVGAKALSHDVRLRKVCNGPLVHQVVHRDSRILVAISGTAQNVSFQDLDALLTTPLQGVSVPARLTALEASSVAASSLAWRRCSLATLHASQTIESQLARQAVQDDRSVGRCSHSGYMGRLEVIKGHMRLLREKLPN